MIKEVVFGAPIRIDNELVGTWHVERSNYLCVKQGQEYIFKPGPKAKRKDTVVTSAANVKFAVVIEEAAPPVDFETSAHLSEQEAPIEEPTVETVRRGRRANAKTT